MAELFNVEVHTINYHLKEIYASGELMEPATIRKIRIVQNESERKVPRQVDFYNLDAIIAVGYRVNSRQAMQFRIWAITGQTAAEIIANKRNELMAELPDEIFVAYAQPNGNVDRLVHRGLQKGKKACTLYLDGNKALIESGAMGI